MPKDACYHKVVARYGPKTSAYRSGAMAKCRKVGAANWGNSKKKKRDGGLATSILSDTSGSGRTLMKKGGFKPHMMYDPKTGKGYKADTYEDHVRMDKMGYVHEKPEKVDEAKKFKPGDMWSNDFDYEGMLKFASKVNVNTPIKTLNALFDSATDVNYHTPFRNLGIAIDWIEDGDKKGAKDYFKMFKDDIKKEMKDQGIR